MSKKSLNKTACLVSICMMATVCFSSIAYPMVAINPTVSSDDNRQTASQNTVRRSTEFFTKIKDNILYTETSSYSMQNVRVTYTSVHSDASKSPNKKRLVELIFLNGVLKEVVIHR